MCSWWYIGLSLCSGLHQSLHLSVHSVHPHCFLCLQPSQCWWELLIPCRIFSLSGLLCTHQAGHSGCWGGRGVVCFRTSCTHAHTSLPVQPWGQICQLFPACEHKRTRHILSLPLSLCVLLPSIRCTQVLSMLGELMVQAEWVGEWLGRGEGEEEVLLRLKENEFSLSVCFCSFFFSDIWSEESLQFWWILLSSLWNLAAAAVLMLLMIQMFFSDPFF